MLEVFRARSSPVRRARRSTGRWSRSSQQCYLGVSPNNLKRLHLENKGPVPQIAAGGRRFYTADQMIELRHYLDKNGRSDAKKYVPGRKHGEKLQVIAVVNFKGGSGKFDMRLRMPARLTPIYLMRPPTTKA